MKQWLLATIVVLGGMAHAVELEYASNDQILSELSRRLGGGGGGGGGIGIGQSGSAAYVCTTNGYLYISLSGTQASDEENIYIGSNSSCETQANTLRQYKSKIIGATLAAVCTTTGHLYKYPLRSDGMIGTVSNIYIGSNSSCLAQANQINSGS